MKNVRYALISTLLLMFALPAQALFVNFQDMGNSSERGWGAGHGGPLIISGAMSISAYDGPSTSTDDAFAYLDSANAGLGVCSALTTTHQCTPPSDDNVSLDSGDNGPEYLIITFLANLSIDAIVFNNNHDPDKSLDGDSLSVDGADVTFTDAAASYNTDGGIITTASVLSDGTNTDGNRDYLHDMAGKIFNKNSTLIISYNTNTALRGDQFYITSIGYDVPEPFTLALLGMGLLCIAGLRRRQI